MSSLLRGSRALRTVLVTWSSAVMRALGLTAKSTVAFSPLPSRSCICSFWSRVYSAASAPALVSSRMAVSSQESVFFMG